MSSLPLPRCTWPWPLVAEQWSQCPLRCPATAAGLLWPQPHTLPPRPHPFRQLALRPSCTAPSVDSPSAMPIGLVAAGDEHADPSASSTLSTSTTPRLPRPSVAAARAAAPARPQMTALCSVTPVHSACQLRLGQHRAACCWQPQAALPALRHRHPAAPSRRLPAATHPVLPGQPASQPHQPPHQGLRRARGHERRGSLAHLLAPPGLQSLCPTRRPSHCAWLRAIHKLRERHESDQAVLSGQLELKLALSK
jgi:hypothetical protein